MFNLLISSARDSWDNGEYELERSRFGVEYTANEISERYMSLTQHAIEELMSFPCIFSIENEVLESKIGYITEIRLREASVVIRFEVDRNFPLLPVGAIESLRSDIDLGKWELTRTHWAVKDERLFEILIRRGYVTQAQVEASHAARQPVPIPQKVPQIGLPQSRRVFIVHGHDEIAKLDTARFIESLGLEPIILHQQASAGMTIIEKIEHYSDVGFGIVLYTPCDVGCKFGALTSAYRARQNVIFEHGYLIAKLTRRRVVALVKGQLETPNDISGIVYVTMDDSERWKAEVKVELASAGYAV